MGQPEQLLTVKEVAELFNCSSATVYRRLQEGKLDGLYKRPGGPLAPILFIRSKVDAWMKKADGG